MSFFSKWKLDDDVRNPTKYERYQKNPKKTHKKRILIGDSVRGQKTLWCIILNRDILTLFRGRSLFTRQKKNELSQRGVRGKRALDLSGHVRAVSVRTHVLSAKRLFFVAVVVVVVGRKRRGIQERRENTVSVHDRRAPAIDKNCRRRRSVFLFRGTRR